MHVRATGNEWQKSLWKFLSNPTLEVVAVIVVVLIAAWFVVTTEVELRPQHNQVPVQFGHK